MKSLFVLFLLITASSFAQVGIGNTNPNASSVLDITSTSAGILVPRMTEAQRSAISSPATGLLVYQTNNTTGFWYYDGIQWTALDKTPSWDLSGNTGTIPGTHFLGTTDDVDLVFKRDNVVSGWIGETNSSFGESSLPLSSTGGNNTSIGYQTLLSNTTGSSNIAIGSRALNQNTTGSFNIALGNEAMRLSNSSDGNIAIGNLSLRSATGSQNNIGIGGSTLRNCTSGQSNIALGSFALDNNTTGSLNIAIGLNALSSNTIGGRNIAIGANSLDDNISGQDNVGLGRYTLWNNLGDSNTAVGNSALIINTTGEYNVAVGRRTMNDNTTGSYNTVVGADSGLIISGDLNTVVGYSSGSSTAGNNNVIVGAITGGASGGGEIGDNNIIIGSQALASGSGVSNQIRLGNSAITTARIQVGWTITSDARWKEEVRSLPYGLNFISKIRPVDYIRKNDTSQLREIGFIAQEVNEVLNDLGIDNMGLLTQDGNGYFELRYNDLIGIIIKATQEQQKLIEDQSTKIMLLEKRLSKIENLITH